MAGSAFMTESNMERIVSTLCRVRGAALKLGQVRPRPAPHRRSSACRRTCCRPSCCSSSSACGRAQTSCQQHSWRPPCRGSLVLPSNPCTKPSALPLLHEAIPLFPTRPDTTPLSPCPSPCLIYVFASSLIICCRRSLLGAEWRSKFVEFDSKPFAAASIGGLCAPRSPQGRCTGRLWQTARRWRSRCSTPASRPASKATWRICRCFCPSPGCFLEVGGGALLTAGLFVDQLMAVARDELALECDYVSA
jgi:hypothetical protein